MKPTARVIVTMECNRNCPGCCNTIEGFSPRETTFQDLLKYEEIIITGGEPMLISEYCLEFVHRLRYAGFKGKIYLYCASNKINKRWSDASLIKEVDGITYTIHENPTKRDLQMFLDLCNFIKENSIVSPRLHIDSRVKGIEKQFPEVIWESVTEIWDEIKYFDWKSECPVIETEDILFYDLKTKGE